MMTVEEFKNYFNNVYYPAMDEECKAGEKASKDIVGSHMEDWNRFVISKCGLECRKGITADGNMYGVIPDTIIFDDDDQVISFAEHKGHYTDKPMMRNMLSAYNDYACGVRISGGCPVPLIITATVNFNGAQSMIDGHQNIDVRNNVKFFSWTHEGRNPSKWLKIGPRHGYTLNDGKISGYLNHLGSLRG